MSENQKITVMLVDDHELVRGGVRAYLQSQDDLDVVAEASSGKEAVELAAVHAPDVILMDLIMPEMDGTEATWRVKQVSPRSEIIILTSFHEDSHIFPAIKAGALSYLLKDISPEELTKAIRAAAKGEATLNPSIAGRLMREWQSEDSQSSAYYNQLTNREQEVVQLIAQGLSNQQIADQMFISEKTVKSHVNNVLRKLHLRDRTQTAIFAWREGIVKKEDTED